MLKKKERGERERETNLAPVASETPQWNCEGNILVRTKKRRKGEKEKRRKVLSRKCSGRNGKVLEGDRQTPEDNKVNKVENNLMEQKLLPWENQYNQ